MNAPTIPGRTVPKLCSTPAVLEYMREHPDYEKIKDEQWKAIYTLWDISVAKKKAPTHTEWSRASGVHSQTLYNWMAKPEFLQAINLVKIQVLTHMEPAIINKGYELAMAGDKALLKLFLEHMLPQKAQPGPNDPPPVSVSWLESEPNETHEQDRNKEIN